MDWTDIAFVYFGEGNMPWGLCGRKENGCIINTTLRPAFEMHAYTAKAKETPA